MKDTITQSQFTDAMTQKDHGFSYDGAKALFEKHYFETHWP